LKRELREQIKQDDFATGLEKAAAWAGSHQDELRIGVGVAVVLFAAVGALAYFRAQRAREAERTFQEAIAAYGAPVTAELAPGADRSGGQVFASSEDRYKTAAAAFEGVGRRYPSSALGLRAQYYAALCRMELKQYAEAEKALKEVQAKGGSGLEGDLARVGLANLYRRSGQTEKAVEAFRGLATSPTASMPRDYALLSLAGTLEDAKRFEEARAAYRELAEQFPASVYAAEARARAEYLQTASRG
jgi:tetratricopeptide (TPR) repeat protein